MRSRCEISCAMPLSYVTDPLATCLECQLRIPLRGALQEENAFLVIDSAMCFKHEPACTAENMGVTGLPLLHVDLGFEFARLCGKFSLIQEIGIAAIHAAVLDEYETRSEILDVGAELNLKHTLRHGSLRRC